MMMQLLSIMAVLSTTTMRPTMHICKWRRGEGAGWIVSAKKPLLHGSSPRPASQQQAAPCPALDWTGLSQRLCHRGAARSTMPCAGKPCGLPLPQHSAAQCTLSAAQRRPRMHHVAACWGKSHGVRLRYIFIFRCRVG